VNVRKLTDKEIEALRLVASGKVPAQVVRDMPINRNTFKDTMARVRERLGATTTAHAVYIACQRGIL
jgi:DNA-binding CsgD family transcriptional regulator